MPSKTRALVLALLVCAAGLARGQEASPTSTVDDAERVSLNLRNVELLRVVEILLHDRGLNIVAAPELNKKVTVRLQGVKWREALDVILRQSGMGMEQTGNILRIDTLERILGSPVRIEYPVTHIEKADLEQLVRGTITPPSSFQVLETPRGQDRARALTLILTATGPDHEKVRALLARADVSTSARPVKVTPACDPSTYCVVIDDMPVAQAVEQLGDALGFSVVWEDPPKGRARTKLDRVTVAETLGAVLSPLGYAFELSGRILRIGERARFQSQLKTRLFKMKFANPVHVKALLQPLLTARGKIEVLGDVKEDFKTQASTTAPAPTATTTVNGITRTGGQRGRQTQELTRAQPPSGTILVTDTPQVLDQIDEMVCQLDHPAEVVEIETKLVEVVLTNETQLGIKWDANISANGASGTVVRFPLQQDQVNANALTNSFTLGTLSASNFNVMLRALSQHNKVKVLSAPRVATLSHEPARILIGQRFPITVQSASQQVNVLTTTLDYYEDIGIALTVTPRVTSKDLINLALKPEVSTIASLIDNRFPVIDTREAETRLILRSGHTAVIGGLLQDRVEKDDQGLPALGRIPILGRLFSQNHTTKKRTELLVCVTPRILAQDPDNELEKPEYGPSDPRHKKREPTVRAAAPPVERNRPEE